MNENFILKAYDNANSFEQYQAQTIIQNAVIFAGKRNKNSFFQLVSTFEGSSLRDMNPTIGVERLENRFAFALVAHQSSIILSTSEAPICALYFA